MLDLGPFSDEKFDAKRWVNSSCKARHPQDSLERHLVDLEMKLQIASEEIGASLEEQSGGALLRVPRATRDVLRLRDDAVSLRSSVAGILQKLKKAEGSSAECIATLARVDCVKQRMEAAYKTLQDAAGLTQLSSTVEDVFASGDLPRAAETLASMRNCLSAVGEVAEFANVRKQLEVLEDRLEAMVQPRLTDALTYHKVDVAQDLRGILIRIGRFKSLELQYSKVRLKPIKQLWDDFDTKQRANKLASERSETQRLSSGDEVQLTSSTQTSFASWLPTFYDELLLYLEQEWKWCMVAFPDDYMTLVPKLLVETMGVLGASFASRLNLATGDAVPETKTLAKGVMDLLSGDLPKGINIQTKHLEALIDLHNVTGSFARNVQHLFAESEVRVLIDTLKAVYSPFESFKQKYGKMERAVLSSEIAVVDLRGAVTRGVGAQGIELSETVRRMEESIPQVVVLLEAAVERCIGFTGGSEADELILALDDIMLQYISMLQETLKSLRVVFGVDGSGDGVSSEKRESSRKMDLSSNEEWSIVQGALQILTVSDCLTSRSSVLEASLRATLARLNSSLSISLFGTNLDQNLSHLTSEQTAGDLSMAGRASLEVAAIRLVDVPEKARKLLNLLEQSKDPRFHALPLASQRVATFADTVNELVYDILISKVRQRLGELEPLAEGISTNGDSNNEDAQFFATEWMFKVAEGATALYVEQLRGIQYITDRGAQQLSVDIEYLSNVLLALSMPIPPVLATFQTCLATPRDELKDVMKSEAGSELDFPTANLVCKMRRISFD
ncbi:BnaA02g11250D [Brassica napus]|uniref:Conserved oligomeric Golgi complex subunit 7 n=1 Tax=Brassica napus TaxID=3708 RepID=A0A078J2X6_BRANA|nr:BnaA02g11250D [Brassica napus]